MRHTEAPGPLAAEASVRINLDSRLLVDLWCTPQDLEDLALGYLLSSGALGKGSAVDQVRITPPGGAESREPWSIEVVTGPAGATAGDSDAPGHSDRTQQNGEALLERLVEVAKQVMEDGPLRRLTGGVHSAGALLPDGSLLCREDVSRHSALDKAIGAASREGPLDPVALFSSGRAAWEMVAKVVDVGAGAFVCRGIPTEPAYELARGSGITLVGRILSGTPIVYTGELPW